MWPRSVLYPQALARPHQVIFRMTSADIDGNPLTRDLLGNPQLLPIEYSGGTVAARLTNRVTRSASFSVHESLYPRTATDPMSETNAVITIVGGLKYGDGTEEVFPLFKGRVQNVERGPNGVVDVECNDLAADVVAYRFEQLWTVRNPASCLDEIEAMILDAVPQAVFSAHDVTDAPVPTDLTFDEDRGQALDDLAEALGGRWYSLGDGSFTVRRFPYDEPTPLTTIADGTDGLLAGARIWRSRDGVANSITVISERADGTAPVKSTSRDLLGSSPTRFGGPFGRASQVIKIQTPVTQSEAKTLSDAQLNASIALTEQWDIACVPDYSLQEGDPVRVMSRGLTGIQIIDSITYPLQADGSQSIGGRAFTPAGVTLDV
jgi:hypothetical protein